MYQIHNLFVCKNYYMNVLLLLFLCRMYGRAPKMIHLEANFVHFKEELLPKKGNKALLTFPFLHIYWTDCCVSSSSILRLGLLLMSLSLLCNFLKTFAGQYS